MSLILTRKPTESVTLYTPDGGSIIVTAVSINGQQVKLSLDAPDDIDILRSELRAVDDSYCLK